MAGVREPASKRYRGSPDFAESHQATTAGKNRLHRIASDARSRFRSMPGTWQKARRQTGCWLHAAPGNHPGTAQQHFATRIAIISERETSYFFAGRSPDNRLSQGGNKSCQPLADRKDSSYRRMFLFARNASTANGFTSFGTTSWASSAASCNTQVNCEIALEPDDPMTEKRAAIIKPLTLERIAIYPAQDETDRSMLN